jgi:hypothetical protein
MPICLPTASVTRDTRAVDAGQCLVTLSALRAIDTTVTQSLNSGQLLRRPDIDTLKANRGNMTQVASLTAPTLSPTSSREPTRRAVRWLLAPLFGHIRAVVLLNLLYFGTCVLAAIYGLTNPVVQSELWKVAREAFSPTGNLGGLVQAYTSGDLLGAVLLTFLVNLELGSAVVLTLPSAIVPFAGILLGLYRAALWGLLFAPTEASGLGSTLWLHMPTILLEGEAYIVAMLGVWLWWRPVFGRSGSRWTAWRRGAFLQVRVYAVVATLLALAAAYEAIEGHFAVAARFGLGRWTCSFAVCRPCTEVSAVTCHALVHAVILCRSED